MNARQALKDVALENRQRIYASGARSTSGWKRQADGTWSTPAKGSRAALPPAKPNDGGVVIDLSSSINADYRSEAKKVGQNAI